MLFLDEASKSGSPAADCAWHLERLSCCPVCSPPSHFVAVGLVAAEDAPRGVGARSSRVVVVVVDVSVGLVDLVGLVGLVWLVGLTSPPLS